MTAICFLVSVLTLMTSCQGQCRTVYDLISSLPSTPLLKVEESLPVPVKSKCSLYCQDRFWCHYFAVCSPTASTMTCSLLKEDDTPSGPQLTMATCKLYKEKSTTPVVCDDGTATSGSSCTSSSQNTTPEHQTGQAVTPSANPLTSDPSTNRVINPSTSYPSTIGHSTTTSTDYPVGDMTDMCGDASYQQQPCSTFFRDCYETSSYAGINMFTILPQSDQDPIQVPCLNGKTIIQRRARTCSAGFFNRSWSEYESGFGDVNSCFWLGNANIRNIITSSSDYDLYITISGSGYQRQVDYTCFRIDTPENSYKLEYNTFESYDDQSNADGFEDIEHSGSISVNGEGFFTSDRDSQNACAAQTGSGWWFTSICTLGNLNHENGPKWPGSSGQVRTYDTSMMTLDRVNQL